LFVMIESIYAGERKPGRRNNTIINTTSPN
jgi:hypothetical protein